MSRQSQYWVLSSIKGRQWRSKVEVSIMQFVCLVGQQSVAPVQELQRYLSLVPKGMSHFGLNGKPIRLTKPLTLSEGQLQWQQKPSFCSKAEYSSCQYSVPKATPKRSESARPLLVVLYLSITKVTRNHLPFWTPEEGTYTRLMSKLPSQEREECKLHCDCEIFTQIYLRCISEQAQQHFIPQNFLSVS